MQNALRVFREYAAKKRLKLTPQRLRIVEVFLNSSGHLTAEDLYQLARKEDTSVGQATVYRTLKILCDAQIARELAFGDGSARYENRIGLHHDHLICDECGKTIEFIDDDIERLQAGIAAKRGFELTSHRLYLYGICPDCAARQNSDASE